MPETFALITGASRGLGKCFALELARRGFNTILVSLPGENLESVCSQCRDLGVESFFYETDLISGENLKTLTGQINTSYPVNILINNAGTGGTCAFLLSDPDYIENIIRLNINTTVLITRHILPNLSKHERSYILNVASMASFSPMANKSVYSASKRFIHHFSTALKYELKNKGVTVSVVFPAAMKTNESVSGRIEKMGGWAKFGLMTPERVAEISINRLLKGKTFIVPGFANKITWLAGNIFPAWIKMPFLSRTFRRDIQASNNTIA